MLFTRIHTYHFPVRKDELKNRLVGKHVNIHDIDFEVFEKNDKLSIVPHAEQVETIKTLPITSVVLHEQDGQTKVTVTSRMRQLDSGGPLLIILFCAFIFAASFVMLEVNKEPFVAFSMMGMGAIIFTSFCIRLQMGYFDYVRKVREYITQKANGSAALGSMPVAA